MNLMIKFSLAFAACGLVISTVFGFIGGNQVFTVIMTAFICTVLSGGLGVGTFKVLELRVPEFLDLFSGEGIEASGLEGLDSGELLDEDEDGFGEGPAVASVGADEEGAKSFGDHLLVNKVKIKNEPRLIAQAIRTMMARDDDK